MERIHTSKVNVETSVFWVAQQSIPE
jgi:hypothetical protein